MNDNFIELMRAFQANLDIEPAPSDAEDELFGIAVGQTEVFFNPSPDGKSILMFSILGDLPAGREIEARKAVLAANCLFQGVGRASLAMAESGEVVLQRDVNLARAVADLEAFGAEVAQFIDVAEDWRDRLPELGKPENDEAPARPDADGVRA